MPDDSHVKQWQERQVDGCPNPCKLYGYNEIVRNARNGEVVAAPDPKEVAHHNFV